MAIHEPDRLNDVVSLTELVWAAPPEARQAIGGLASWGPSAIAASGCLCTWFPEPRPIGDALGREGAGFIGAHVADLKLRLAELLEEADMPPTLLRAVLAVATLEFIGEARQAHADDWVTVAQHARSLTRTRLDDYLATLTANGPLTPVSGTPRRE